MATRGKDLVSVAAALAWVDANTRVMTAEDVALIEAAGRIAAREIATAAALPAFDRAATDGVALKARETIGASAYNPLSFALTSGGVLGAMQAVGVQAGDRLPQGADAIVPLDHVALDQAAGWCEIVEPVASGRFVEREGAHAGAGATLLAPGGDLRPEAIGLLASAGLERVPVIRRPKVRILLTGRGLADGTLRDADGPLLRALVERDGGVVAETLRLGQDKAETRAALLADGADIVLVAGGTGEGATDSAPDALAEAGTLALHGVALNPGTSAGMGQVGPARLVILLPGAPVACLWAYEFFAGRAIRRMAGHDPALPFVRRQMLTSRKIVSSIGLTEICPVSCSNVDIVEPLVSFSARGLVAAVQADGFVVISEGSEGFPEGAAVEVHLHEARR